MNLENLEQEAIRQFRENNRIGGDSYPHVVEGSIKIESKIDCVWIHYEVNSGRNIQHRALRFTNTELITVNE
jgi:hypothetical protein